MKNISFFLFENFQFSEVKFSIYLNRRVFVMCKILYTIYSGHCDNHNRENTFYPPKHVPFRLVVPISLVQEAHVVL